MARLSNNGIGPVREALARLEVSVESVKSDVTELKTRVEPAIQAGRDQVSLWKSITAGVALIGLAIEIVLRIVGHG